MNAYTFLLCDGTVGKIISANEPFVGRELTVTVHDEKGCPVKATGIVREILEKRPPWQLSPLATRSQSCLKADMP